MHVDLSVVSVATGRYLRESSAQSKRGDSKRSSEPAESLLAACPRRLTQPGFRMARGNGDTSRARDTAETSRKIRSRYKALAQSVKEKEADLRGHEVASMLCNTVQQANELLKGVEKPREQAADSEIFLSCVEAGTKFAKKLNQGTEATMPPMEFVRIVRRKFISADQNAEDVEMDPSIFNWEKLGADVAGRFAGTPGVCTMNGPMDTEPKQRKIAERKRRKPTGELQRAQEISKEEMDKMEKQETDRNMEEMWKLLHKEQPKTVLSLIMNHNSFAQTVENLFSLSFLVKDQKVKLVKNPEGLSVVKARAPEKADFDSGKAENMQFIVPMDMELWRQLQEWITPDKCLMRNRASHKESVSQPVAVV